jgi:hypothetical protein
MENQEVSSKQVMLNYGLMLGIATVVISVANYAFGNAYEPHWSVNVISLLLMIAFITLGIKKVKESNSGLLTLGEGLKTGMGIALISGLIGIAYFLIFVNFIDPDFFNQIAAIQEQKWYDAGMAEEQIEMSKEMMSKMSGPGITAGFMIAFTLFIGFIISLIAGLVMKQTAED